MIILKFIKKFLIPLVVSIILFFIILIIFHPIFNATTLIFPYSLNKFDIILKYPVVWNYIKKIYCITSFITFYLLTFSLQNFILIKKQKKIKKSKKLESINNDANYNLLLGNNSENEKVYIPENGLYQNILVTGTIGSR